MWQTAFPTAFELSSLISVRVETRSATDRVIDTATAFWFRPASGQLYLVTNWHVVTGRDPRKPAVSVKGAVPTKLIVHAHLETQPGEIGSDAIAKLLIPLNDEDGEAPRWLEHPWLRNSVDVVALKINDTPPLHRFAIRAIGDDGIFDNTPGYVPQVMHDVYVLGYPWGLAGGTRALPIYKRGSIASEPGLPQGGFPRFLIDCRSARGMSGAPVIAASYVSGAVGKSGEKTLWAHAHAFAGIYSGRLTVEDLQSESVDSASLQAEAAAAISEIGIVWRRDVLVELVTNPSPGRKLSEI